MARGKLRQASHGTGAEEDGPICPLCVEVLDDYERSWKPCHCGYQVCAFCYGRLNLEFKNQCPACRQEYGSTPAVSVDSHTGVSAEPPMAAKEPDTLPIQNGAQPLSAMTSGQTAAPSEALETSVPQTISNSHIANGAVASEPVVPPSPRGAEITAGAEALPKSHQESGQPLEENKGSHAVSEEEPERPKIQPTKIKTRPWAIADTGQQKSGILQQKSPLAPQAWPLLGSETSNQHGETAHADAEISQTPNVLASASEDPPVPAKAKSEASEQLRAFLDLAQRRQMQNARPSSRGESILSQPSSGGQQVAAPRPLDGRIIKPPPGYDRPLPQWSVNGQAAKPAVEPTPQPVQDSQEMQDKFRVWWQTVNSGAQLQDAAQGPTWSGSNARAAENPAPANNRLPSIDSAHDLVRQAADAHGSAYPILSPSPSPTPPADEDPYKPNHSLTHSGLGLDNENNGSDKSLEKLYSIWPAHARSTQSDSGGPSSLSSTHNMWAVHNKQSNGVSALWNPQPSEPIPDSLQELWANDKPSVSASQQSHQPQKTSIGMQPDSLQQQRSSGFQQERFSPMPDYLASHNQSEDQYGYNSSQGYNVARGMQAGNGLNRSQTQTPVSNGILGSFGQGLNTSRPYQGLTPSQGMNGLGQQGLGGQGLGQQGLGGQGLGQQGLGGQGLGQHSLNQSALGFNQSLGQRGLPLNDPPVSQYGNQANLQAAQTLLGLQLQAALKQQQFPTNQSGLLQAQAQQNRFPAQNQLPRGYPQTSAPHNLHAMGLSNLAANAALPQPQNLNQQALNLSQGLANLGITPAYAAQLLGQLGLGSGQSLGGSSLQNSLLNDTRNGRNGQFDLGSQLYNSGLGSGLGASLGGGLGGGSAADLNQFRIQQALQASNLHSQTQNEKLQFLQSIAAQQAQERQKQQLLELYKRQQQSQAFPPSQNLRQDQSRFAGQMGNSQRLVGQSFQANFNQGPNQILQQNRLGRSGSPAGFQHNSQFANRSYQQ